MKNFIKRIIEYGKYGSWTIAFRKRNSDILSDDSPFVVFKEKKRFWVADPFLFELEGKAYVFAEKFDLKTRKGCISYIEISDRKAEWHDIISEEHHLSFPFIFQDDDGIHIMPESNQSNALYLYTATAFPNKWKRRLLLDNVRLSDTAFVQINGVKLYYSLMHKKAGDRATREPVLFALSGDKTMDIKRVASFSNRNSRLGGAFFQSGSKTVMVSQNCANFYGESLVFSNVEFRDDTLYKEEIKEVRISDIHLDSKKHYVGVHTYNASEKYEVIDLFRTRFSFMRILRRILHGKK